MIDDDSPLQNLSPDYGNTNEMVNRAVEQSNVLLNSVEEIMTSHGTDTNNDRYISNLHK